MPTRTMVGLNGTSYTYVLSDNPPEGGMKRTYFSADRSYVVQLYKDQNHTVDIQRIARLEKILGPYNPTLTEAQGGRRSTSLESATYYQSLFCWPTDIILQPELAIVSPCYPSEFFFDSGNLKGHEKKSKWFCSPKLRKMLAADVRGTWIDYFKIAISLVRAVRTLHMAGLAHSDLSPNNILVDPKTGRVVVIDIDSLVVEGLFPPEVMGTPGYIAPEVIATQHLPINDQNRRHPSLTTDLHALAVLLYQFLLYRHPLTGPKVNSTLSAEDDERLSMGEKALYIEHPSDKSNRPPKANMKHLVDVLGHDLKLMFERAFISGLHTPVSRPTAIEWEHALLKTWDRLVKCKNDTCEYGWFVLSKSGTVSCPFCKKSPEYGVPVLSLQKEVRTGVWMQDSELAVYSGSSLFAWHVRHDSHPGVGADRAPKGYMLHHAGKWLFVNQSLPSLTSPSGTHVAIGQAIELRDGCKFRLDSGDTGRMVKVEIRC